MQILARSHVTKILDEQEKLNNELEAKKRELDSWNRELNKREAQTELERQKLDDEKKKVVKKTSQLLLISQLNIQFFWLPNILVWVRIWRPMILSNKSKQSCMIVKS